MVNRIRKSDQPSVSGRLPQLEGLLLQGSWARESLFIVRDDLILYIDKSITYLEISV